MPKVSLLVLNSLSFPLSNLPNPRTKPGILEHIKQVFTKAAVMKNLTVRYSAASDLILRVNRTQQIVTTSQLATKVLKDDGSPGNLAEGGRIMVVPQLGNPLTFFQISQFLTVVVGSSYLPSVRSHRILLSLDSPVSGYVLAMVPFFPQPYYFIS